MEQSILRHVFLVVVLHMVHGAVGDGDERVETSVLRVPAEQEQIVAGSGGGLPGKRRDERFVPRETVNVRGTNGAETRDRNTGFVPGQREQLVYPLQEFHNSGRGCVVAVEHEKKKIPWRKPKRVRKR